MRCIGIGALRMFVLVFFFCLVVRAARGSTLFPYTTLFRSSRQEDGAGAGDSQVLAQVTEKAEQAARDVFAAHTLADCLRLRRTESRVFHGIFHSAPANRKDA